MAANMNDDCRNYLETVVEQAKTPALGVQRAYSAFAVKAIDAKARSFSGWATTPAMDRMGDTVNPLGATFQNPLVLLHQHNPAEPIGQVVFEKPTQKGIQFTATIPTVDEPGSFKDRVDTAWAEIQYGVVRAVSIGFRPLKYAFNENGGVDFQELEIYELSAVSIPALPQAVITQVKSMAGGQLPRDVIHKIREQDVLNKGVKLISAEESSLRRGAVKLVH